MYKRKCSNWISEISIAFNSENNWFIFFSIRIIIQFNIQTYIFLVAFVISWLLTRWFFSSWVKCSQGYNYQCKYWKQSNTILLVRLDLPPMTLPMIKIIVSKLDAIKSGVIVEFETFTSGIILSLSSTWHPNIWTWNRINLLRNLIIISNCQISLQIQHNNGWLWYYLYVLWYEYAMS